MLVKNNRSALLMITYIILLNKRDLPHPYYRFTTFNCFNPKVDYSAISGAALLILYKNPKTSFNRIMPTAIALNPIL